MPCWELFDRQPREYRDAGAAAGGDGAGRRSSRRRRSAGTATSATGGAIVGMHTFGASAPLKELLTKFGFTPERVAEVARELVAARQEART